jgi:hypothetical protein
MERTKVSTERVDTVKHEVMSPDGETERRKAEMETAAQPASGAPVQRAAAGAALGAEERASDRGETAEALKRAAENDTRV